MQDLIPPSHSPVAVTLGATVVAWLPYLDMGLRVIASLIAIYSGILYIRKIRK